MTFQNLMNFELLTAWKGSLKLKLENLGAKVANSISKKTDYLIAGSDSGTKLSKAKQLNIDIISDSDLESFINNLWSY